MTHIESSELRLINNFNKRANKTHLLRIKTSSGIQINVVNWQQK